jgi:hypothetical protein
MSLPMTVGSGKCAENSPPLLSRWRYFMRVSNPFLAGRLDTEQLAAADLNRVAS